MTNAEEMAILEKLRQALEEEGLVPDRVRQAGYAAFAWRGIDEELAELLYDSAVHERQLANVRADQASVRAMTFSGERARIDLQVSETEVLGQVTPADYVEVLVLDNEGNSVTLPVDDLGCFSLTPVPNSPFRLRFQGEHPVTTGQIVL